MDAGHVLRRRDALGPELRHHAAAVELRRELRDVDEPGAPVVRIVGERSLDPVQLLEHRSVTRRRGGPQLQDPVELLELGDSDRGLDVRPAVVEAEPHVVEPGALAVGAALVPEADEQLPLLLGMRRDDAAFAGRHLLVRVEAEHRRRAVGTDRAALVLGAERLGRVLDQRQAVPFADRAQLVELARVAEHVDGHDRLRPRGDRRVDRGRVEVQRRRVDVREHRRRALEDEAVRRGDERDRRRDHLVAQS